jgi:hypothetical protein
MFHRVFLALLLLIGVAMVSLSLVFPQGQGAVSPPPFNRPLASPESAVTIGGRPVPRLRADDAAEALSSQP